LILAKGFYLRWPHFLDPRQPNVGPKHTHDYDPDVHHDLLIGQRDDDCGRRRLGDSAALGPVWW
jgi:hypothetical protein